VKVVVNKGGVLIPGNYLSPETSAMAEVCRGGFFVSFILMTKCPFGKVRTKCLHLENQ